MNTVSHHPEGGERVEDLLPWYAAGTLGKAESALVEAALAKDPELQRRLDIAREEMGETVLLNQSLGTPSAAVLERLFAKIDEEPSSFVGVPSRIFDLGARLSHWLRPKTLAWVAIAAAAIIVLQAGLLIGVAGRPDETTQFQTASQEGTGKVESGTFLLVSFTAQAPAGEIAALLAAEKASIVDGPRAGEFYKLRIGETAMPRAEIDRILADLRGQTRLVRFAGEQKP